MDTGNKNSKPESSPFDEFSPLARNSKLITRPPSTRIAKSPPSLDEILAKLKKARWPLVVTALLLAFVAPQFSSIKKEYRLEEFGGILGASAGATAVISAILGYVIFRGRKSGWSSCFCIMFFIATAYRCITLVLR
jgi:hypothetical protein